MPPVLGPVSPSKARLWSCAAASGRAVRAVDQREEAGFLARQKILDHDLGPGRAEPSLAERGVDRRVRLGEVAATTTPLPAASPSALTTTGAPCAAT